MLTHGGRQDVGCKELRLCCLLASVCITIIRALHPSLTPHCIYWTQLQRSQHFKPLLLCAVDAVWSSTLKKLLVNTPQWCQTNRKR